MQTAYIQLLQNPFFDPVRALAPDGRGWQAHHEPELCAGDKKDRGGMDAGRYEHLMGVWSHIL